MFKEETVELERFPFKIDAFDKKILNNKKLVLDACPTGPDSPGHTKVKEFPCGVVIQETQLLIDLRNSFVIQATNILNEDKNEILNSRLKSFLENFHKEQSICDPKSNFGVICGQHIAPSAIDSSLKGHKVNTHVILQRDKFYLQVKVPLN